CSKIDHRRRSGESINCFQSPGCTSGGITQRFVRLWRRVLGCIGLRGFGPAIAKWDPLRTRRRRLLRFQAEWIEEIDWVVVGVGIGVDSACEADRVFANKAVDGGIVVSGAEIIEPRRIRLASNVLVAVCIPAVCGGRSKWVVGVRLLNRTCRIG